MKSSDLIPQFRSVALGAIAAFSLGQPVLRAADHRDAPNLAHDAACDLADVYLFMDPNNTGTDDKVVMIATFHGFIVPGEAANEAIFDPNARYRFEIYDAHVQANAFPVDPGVNATPAQKAAFKKAKAKYLASIKPAKTIDVTFDARVGKQDPNAHAGQEALEIPKDQTATVQFTGFAGIKKTDKFTATVPGPNLGTTPVPPAATGFLDKAGMAALPGFQIFAGEADDPFFFDIPGFSGVIKSIRTTGAPDGSLGRGRDTFAGYNVLSIALSLPKTAVTGVAGTKIGVDVLAQRHAAQLAPNKLGVIKGAGAYKTVDRMGNPAVNVVLLPFSQKNAYNYGTAKDDASLKFLGFDQDPKTPTGILDTLKALGTSDQNIGTLASIAVNPGDLLILDTAVSFANAGFATAGGGRRLQDDVVDTLLFVVTNGLVTPQASAITTGGDNVFASDGTLQGSFPFLAPTNQPQKRNMNSDPAPAPDTTLSNDNTRH
jgi:hypothetical protein